MSNSPAFNQELLLGRDIRHAEKVLRHGHVRTRERDAEERAAVLEPAAKIVLALLRRKQAGTDADGFALRMTTMQVEVRLDEAGMGMKSPAKNATSGACARSIPQLWAKPRPPHATS